MKDQRIKGALTNAAAAAAAAAATPTIGPAVSGNNGWVVVPRPDPSRLSWGFTHIRGSRQECTYTSRCAIGRRCGWNHIRWNSNSILYEYKSRRLLSIKSWLCESIWLSSERRFYHWTLNIWNTTYGNCVFDFRSYVIQKTQFRYRFNIQVCLSLDFCCRISQSHLFSILPMRVLLVRDAKMINTAASFLCDNW